MAMNLYTAIAICIVFVCLMTVVIVNETISVVDILSTKVSSVKIETLTGPHRFSMIGLTGQNVNGSSFNVSQVCSCDVKKTDEAPVDCDTLTLEHQTAENEPGSILLTRGPTDWQNMEQIEFMCTHDFMPLITYMVMADDYQLLKSQVTGNDYQAASYLDENIFNSPWPWISSNTYNQVLLSREDHYENSKLQKSYIKTTISQAAHQSGDFTRIDFTWREGQVNKINKFVNGSYWSLATLMCTVILGVERCIAFVTRAKNGRNKAPPQNGITQVKQAPTPSPEPPTYSKNQDDAYATQWGGFEK